MIRSTIRRLRGGIADERGMTVTEVLVSCAVFTVVATIAVTTLFSVQKSVAREGYRAEVNAQARLAFQRLEREIRSGSVLYDPAAEPAPSAPYFGLRLLTHANANTRSAGAPSCVQWRVSGQRLLRRQWPAGNPSGATPWSTVATDIVNQALAPQVAAFSRDPGMGRNTVHVVLLLNGGAGPGTTSPQPTRLETTIALRNYVQGDPCSPVPAG